MFEELIIALFNAVAFSAIVFYPVYMSGSFVLFFLVKFVTSAIGIGAPPSPINKEETKGSHLRIQSG